MLEKAAEKFNFRPKADRIIDKIVVREDCKKAFMYVFWVYFGMRFQSSAFTKTGNRPWHSRKAAELLKPVDQRESINNSICQSLHNEDSDKEKKKFKLQRQNGLSK